MGHAELGVALRFGLEGEITMTRKELITLCLRFPDAYEDYPFGSEPDGQTKWTVIRHRSNRRSFALIFERGGLCVNLKCDPPYADLLRRSFESITPAYHMNKVHWNTVMPNGDLPYEELIALIEHSYRLTLPKKAKNP